MKKEYLKDQKAFYKEYEKQVEANKGDYCMEDFAYDFFIDNKRLKRLVKALSNPVLTDTPINAHNSMRKKK